MFASRVSSAGFLAATLRGGGRSGFGSAVFVAVSIVAVSIAPFAVEGRSVLVVAVALPFCVGFAGMAGFGFADTSGLRSSGDTVCTETVL